MQDKKKPVLMKSVHRSTVQEAEMALKKIGKKSSKKIPVVKITPVSPEHTPVNEDGVQYVFANIETSLQGGRTALLSHRNTVNIDCGFTAKVPTGFELVLDLL